MEGYPEEWLSQQTFDGTNMEDQQIVPHRYASLSERGMSSTAPETTEVNAKLRSMPCWSKLLVLIQGPLGQGPLLLDLCLCVFVVVSACFVFVVWCPLLFLFVSPVFAFCLYFGYVFLLLAVFSVLAFLFVYGLWFSVFLFCFGLGFVLFVLVFAVLGLFVLGFCVRYVCLVSLFSFSLSCLMLFGIVCVCVSLCLFVFSFSVLLLCLCSFMVCSCFALGVWSVSVLFCFVRGWRLVFVVWCLFSFVIFVFVC